MAAESGWWRLRDESHSSADHSWSSGGGGSSASALSFAYASASLPPDDDDGDDDDDATATALTSTSLLIDDGLYRCSSPLSKTTFVRPSAICSMTVPTPRLPCLTRSPTLNLKYLASRRVPSADSIVVTTALPPDAAAAGAVGALGARVSRSGFSFMMRRMLASLSKASASRSSTFAPPCARACSLRGRRPSPPASRAQTTASPSSRASRDPAHAPRRPSPPIASDRG